MFGRGAYAISLALVSAAGIGCKDDPVVGPDASITAPDATAPVGLDAAVHADATVHPDAAVVVEPPPPVCPRGPGTPVMGDVNGDGVADLADPIAHLGFLFRGARGPACVAAADHNGDGRLEGDDALRMHSVLVTGTQGVRSLLARDCANLTTPWPAGRCVPLAWDLAAPARVTEGRFTAEIAVRSSTLTIQAWSMSVSASGCTVAAASTARTSSADIWDDPPGLRHLGYAVTKPVEGGAIGYVALAHHEDGVLPAAERTVLMRVEVEAPVPGEGCAPCTLTIDGERRWEGRPVAPVVVSDGRAYVPADASATVEVCAQ